MNVLNFFGSQSQEGVALVQRPKTASVQMCSGYGQWHSPKNKKCPKQYTTVTYDHIVEMAKNPPQHPKDRRAMGGTVNHAYQGARRATSQW